MIYICGGCNDTEDALKSVLKYNPLTGIHCECQDMNYERSYFKGVAVGNITLNL